MANIEFPATAVEEHDKLFGVKKVSNFIDNGNGGLVRQSGNSNGAVNIVTVGYTSITSNNATNNTAGTAVQLASAACSMVEIFIPTGNTSSQVAIGDSGCKASSGSEKGLILISGSSAKFYVTNANLLWFDVGTSGDKISYNVYS